MKFKIFFVEVKQATLQSLNCSKHFFYPWFSITILSRKARIFNLLSVTSRGRIMNYNHLQMRNAV